MSIPFLNYTIPWKLISELKLEKYLKEGETSSSDLFLSGKLWGCVRYCIQKLNN